MVQFKIYVPCILTISKRNPSALLGLYEVLSGQGNLIGSCML